MNNIRLLATISEASTIEAPSVVGRIAHQFGVEAPLLIAQIVNFCLVAFLLYRFALKPILSTLDARKAKIVQSLNDAEAITRKLSEIEAHHTEAILKASLEAQAMIQQAKKNAQGLLDETVHEAQLRAQSILTEGQASLKLEQAQMMQAARQEMAQLVVSVAQKVLIQELPDQTRSVFTQKASELLTQKHS